MLGRTGQSSIGPRTEGPSWWTLNRPGNHDLGSTKPRAAQSSVRPSHWTLPTGSSPRRRVRSAPIQSKLGRSRCLPSSGLAGNRSRTAPTLLTRSPGALILHHECTIDAPPDKDLHVRQSGLFGTAAAMRLIGLFYINPESSFRLIEIVASLRDSVNRRAAINTLNRLIADGFVEKISKGETSRYRANPRCFVFDELASIAVKTIGGYEELVEEIGHDQNIVTAAIYGSFAKGSQRADSDLDLMLVAQDPGALSLFDLLGKIETIAGHAGRQVNATTYTESEAAAGGIEFLSKVLNGPVIWLKGGDHATHNDPG